MDDQGGFEDVECHTHLFLTCHCFKLETPFPWFHTIFVSHLTMFILTCSKSVMLVGCGYEDKRQV